MHPHAHSQPLGHRALRSRQLAIQPLSAPDYASNDSSGDLLLGPNGQIITSADDDVPRAPQLAPWVQESTSQDAFPIRPSSSYEAVPTLSPSTTSAVETAIDTTTEISTSAPTVISTMSTSTSTDTLSPPSVSTNVLASTSSLPPVADPSSSAPSASTPDPTPTSGLDSSSSGSAPTNPAVYTGIALGTIAGVGLVAATLAWWLRTRTRTRRKGISRQVTWPWDHDRLGARRNMLTLASEIDAEGGLDTHAHSHPGDHDRAHLSSWDPALMERRPEALQLADSHAFPLPPPAYLNSPFVSVPLLNARQSVPDIAQDFGTLRVRNVAPGDISGGETTRPSTALGVAHTYDAEVNVGTPHQLQRPAYLALRDGGLDMPWAPLRTRKSTTLSSGGRNQAQEEKHGELLPFPGQRFSLTDPPSESECKEEGWAASLRSNIFSAFSAVVGGTNAQPEDPDTFTRPHPRARSKHLRMPLGPRDSAGVFRSDSNSSSVLNGKEKENRAAWTLEETSDGRGVVHVVADAAPTDPFGDDLALLVADSAGSITRASSVYSTTSVSVSRVDRHPPRLPSIPDFSQTPPTRTRAREEEEMVASTQTTTRQPRPMLAARMSSSQTSATSVGSEMSRASSADLTDSERLAKRVLLERRKRVMEMTVGRGKTRRARATMLSRRRSRT